MVISLYQEAKLFKKVFNHDDFDQQDDEVGSWESLFSSAATPMRCG